MERRADDAERELLQWKKVKFMADKVGDEFEGYVTGVAAFGLFVELVEHYVEGLVHVSTMADDYYRFVEAAHMLRGENTEKTYRLGDKVNVQVVRVNMDARQIDLALVDILERVRERRARAAAVEGTAEDRTPRQEDAAGAAGAGDATRKAPLALVLGCLVGLMPSLKFLIALPMPLPRPGRRLAPKTTMMIARMMSSSGMPMRPMVTLLPEVNPRAGQGLRLANRGTAVILPPRAGLLLSIFVICLGLSAIAAAGGQFASGVNLVEVYATVLDGRGRAGHWLAGRSVRSRRGRRATVD